MKFWKNVLRIITVVSVCVFTRIIAALIFGGDPISKIEPFGALVDQFGVIPIVIISFFLTYLHLTIVCFIFLRTWFGNSLMNGLLFGLSLGMIWFFGMIEAGIIKNAPMFDEIIFGISEALPIVLLGLLLSKICRQYASKQRNESTLHKYPLPIIVISFLYLFGRYLGYVVGNIESSYLQKPLQTLLWTMGNGLLIGLFYFVMRNGLSQYKSYSKAAIFSVWIFGIDWIFYNLFVPVMFNIPISEVLHSFLGRAVIDIIFVGFGIVFTENTILKKSS